MRPDREWWEWHSINKLRDPNWKCEKLEEKYIAFDHAMRKQIIFDMLLGRFKPIQAEKVNTFKRLYRKIVRIIKERREPLNEMKIKEIIAASVNPVEDIVDMEVGWYYQIISLNRATGEIKLQLAKSVWIKSIGGGPMRVVFLDDK